MAKWLCHKYCKIKLSRGAIWHFATREPEAYLETRQASAREHFCKNG